ncbi:MAG: heme a synthase [Thermoplasmata archaeon]|jgi:cytochrome c oxidase assembly protein subunit 15|nr:heme a synthase [Thermoplasmata archaeon]
MERRIARLRRLGILCVAGTVLLMTLGAWVKATGSGLSCPDWPACYGEWLPPFPSMENGGTDPDAADHADGFTQAQVLYEWVHRAVAASLGIPVLLLFLGTRAQPIRSLRADRRLHPGLTRMAAAALGLVLFQATLGAITVRTGNVPWATTAHLVTATAFIIVLTVATCFAYLRPLAGSAPLSVSRGPGFVYPGEDRHG